MEISTVFAFILTLILDADIMMTHSRTRAMATSPKTISTTTRTVSRGNKKRIVQLEQQRSTPMPNRLRLRPNGNADVSSSSSLSLSAIAAKPKTTVSVGKRCGHISGDEKSGENKIVTPISDE